MNDVQNLRETRPAPAIRRRTWLIVFFVVFLPWMLISAPGYEGIRNTSKVGTHYIHGWPLVHLDRNFVVEGRPPNRTAASLAKQGALTRPLLRTNWRFSRAEIPFGSDPGINLASTPYSVPYTPGFWSEASNWPSLNSNNYWQIRPLGLICNLTILALVAYVTARMIQWRLNHADRLLRFSLRSMLVFTAVFACLIAGYVYESSRDRFLDRAVRLMQENGRVSFYVEHEGRFPALVSQLLDHGKFPIDVSDRFVRIKTIHTNLSLNEVIRLGSSNPFRWQAVSQSDVASTIANPKQTANPLTHDSIEIHLSIEQYNQEVVDKLKNLSELKIVGLSIAFNYYDWIDAIPLNGIPLETSKLQWIAEAKKEVLASLVGLRNQFGDLERIELSLKDTYDQPAHLELFRGLKKLETVRLLDVDSEGAAFLLETKEQWPVDTDISFSIEVPNNLRQKLLKFAY